MINPDTFVWPNDEYQELCKIDSCFSNPRLASVLFAGAWCSDIDIASYALDASMIMIRDTVVRDAESSTRFFDMIKDRHWMLFDKSKVEAAVSRGLEVGTFRVISKDLKNEYLDSYFKFMDWVSSL